MRARLALLAVAVATVLAGPALAAETYEVPGLSFPEGIAKLPSEPTFLVASSTTGEVFRGRLGERTVRPFLPPLGDGRAVAAGMRIGPNRAIYLAGFATNQVWVYGADGGELRHVFSRRCDPAGLLSLKCPPVGLLNEIAIAPDGNAYVTDSLVPIIYRITPAEAQPGASVQRPLQPWLDLRGTVAVYELGVGYGMINLNGIVATPDGRYLLAVQTNTGRLYRIDVAAGDVTVVAAPSLTGGDGMVLDGSRLYVVRNTADVVVALELSADFTVATPAGELRDPTFKTPTGIELADDRLLVANSQHSVLLQGDVLGLTLPFTVSSVPKF